ncbi:hypothetical protein [Bacillus marinisedimentorum]|uniref:hypothetical protein n=1 Tax=Bacillus marinisedimentorum TaxID=1821260 RepID=UPI0007DF8E26|nr:hypothetical protein [Bacillus marinisedimentorum]
MNKKRQKKMETYNGNMINDEEELVEHSTVMRHMSTNEDVKKLDKEPDPIQHTRNEQKDDE